MKRRVLTVVLAVLLAISGTAGVLAYVHQSDARALAGMQAVTTLVAQQPVAAGTSVSAAVRSGLLTRQALPARSVPSDAVQSITPGLAGLVMSTDIQPGQLLLRPMLVTAAQVTGAGALAIPRGMVAVTVPFCLPAAVAGYLHSGSQVAVFDTYASKTLNSSDCSGSHSQQQAANGVHTRTVLPRVQILAVGSAAATNSSSANTTALSSSGSSSAATSNQGPVMVTFAVSQADAERLILLNESGVPYLALLTSSSQTGFDSSLPPLFRS